MEPIPSLGKVLNKTILIMMHTSLSSCTLKRDVFLYLDWEIPNNVLKPQFLYLRATLLGFHISCPATHTYMPDLKKW
jgi:hypothetical protein